MALHNLETKDAFRESPSCLIIFLNTAVFTLPCNLMSGSPSEPENIPYSYINMLPPLSLTDFLFTHLGSNLSPLHCLTYFLLSKPTKLKLLFFLERHSCLISLGYSFTKTSLTFWFFFFDEGSTVSHQRASTLLKYIHAIFFGYLACNDFCCQNHLP